MGVTATAEITFVGLPQTSHAQRRGRDSRTRVGDGSSPIPKHEWNSGLLQGEVNTKELFSPISTQISKTDQSS